MMKLEPKWHRIDRKTPRSAVMTKLVLSRQNLSCPHWLWWGSKLGNNIWSH